MKNNPLRNILKLNKLLIHIFLLTEKVSHHGLLFYYQNNNEKKTTQNNSIQKVPITISVSPMKDFNDSFSLKTTMEKRMVTRILNLSIILTIILSLTFIPAVQINAAAKINITYYAGKGYFKAKPNRSKSKITIKNNLNKKRGYAPSIRRDRYTFDGWYTKKKGGKKYSASTIITKKQKLYPHWIKKYKINRCFSITKNRLI